jgi:O-antigen/teichoic acid export membrane protein
MLILHRLLQTLMGRPVGVAFFMRVIGSAVTYLFLVIMARIMEVGDFGLMGTVMSIALLMSVLGCVGQRMALLRYVPPLLKEKLPLQPLVSRAISLAVMGNAILYTLMVCLLFTASVLEGSSVNFVMVLGLLIVPLMGVIDMQSHLALGGHNIPLALLHKDILWRALSAATAVGLFFLLGEKALPLWLVFTILVGVLASLILDQGNRIYHYLGFRPLGLVLSGSLNTSFQSEAAWRESRVDFWVTSVSAVLFSSFDVIVVGLVAGPVEAAFYFAANRIGMILTMFQQSVGVVVAPLMAMHASQREAAELKRVVRSAVIQTVVPASMAAVIILLFDDMILQLFGEQFAAAKSFLWVLVIGRLTFMSLGAGEQLLAMAGEERLARWLSLWSLGLGAVLILMGAWIGGAMGVAWATILSVSARKIMFWRACRVHLGIMPDIWTALWTNRKGSI